jgi:hypothetical protein
LQAGDRRRALEERPLALVEVQEVGHLVVAVAVREEEGRRAVRDDRPRRRGGEEVGELLGDGDDAGVELAGRLVELALQFGGGVVLERPALVVDDPGEPPVALRAMMLNEGADDEIMMSARRRRPPGSSGRR